MRVIVALSGGKSSAWCAKWAFDNYPKNQVVLYFNDTKWEHPDLYRFLNDLEKKFDHPITVDSDGRSPDELFVDQRALANNRMPFCSRILKAERLQRFFDEGDSLVFGITVDEPHRALRIEGVYQKIWASIGKRANLLFPLIRYKVSGEDVDAFLNEAGIQEPRLYKLGFSHNNCSGGCVRAGKKQWALLLKTLPDVYRQREETEERMRNYLGKDVSFLKDETLKDLRERISRYNPIFPDFDDVHECIGICETLN